MTASPTRAPSRRRGLAVVIGGIVAFLLLYGTVVTLYAVGDAERQLGCTDEAPADAVLFSLVPTAVDATGNRIAATLQLLDAGPLATTDSGLLAEPLTIVMTATDGDRSFTLGQDEIPSPVSVRFITTGDVERWPLDAHTTTVGFLAYQQVAGEPSAVPLELCGSAHVPGWDFASREVAGTDELVVDGEPVEQVRLTAFRSAATVTFGVLLLGLMVVLPVAALTVAIVVFRGLRKVEASLMSWMAALLFATLPLRAFLPGSPPVGSWVDYLVVLWVVVGLVVSLVVYVLAWLRWSAPGARSETTSGTGD